jgi:hypothetical protein
MKNWLTYVVAGLLLTSVAACKKDEVRTTIQFGDAPVLTASSTNAGVLLENDSARTAIAFSWTPYTYSVSEGNTVVSPVVYTLQLAKAGTNFAAPVDIAVSSPSTVSLPLNVYELNRNLLLLKAPVRQSAQFDVRLKSMVAGNISPIYSATKTFTATPYEKCLPPNSDTWALVGPAGNGWPSGTPATETGISLKWDCTINAYTARVPLNAGAFKFRKDKAWAINLGGPTGNFAQGVALTLNGSDMTIATAGTYTVKLVVAGSGAGVTGGTVTIVP